MVTLFDYLEPADLLLIDAGGLQVAADRVSDIDDFSEQRGNAAGQAKGSYRPLERDALYLAQAEFDSALADAPAHRMKPFAEPPGKTVLDFGFTSARDFAPERARGDNVYEAAASHFADVAKSGRKAIFAAYSEGSRTRIASILGEAGSPACRGAKAGRRRLGWRQRASPPRWCCRWKAGSPTRNWNC